MRLAGLLSSLLRENGFAPIIVGGSAIEFYTEGAYASGDIDICFDSPKIPKPSDCARIVGHQMGGTGNIRTWKIGDLYVDMLGLVEAFAGEKFASLETPEGRIVLQPLEDLLVERVFIARAWSQPNEEAEKCAQKLLRHIILDTPDFDWNQAEAIASSPAYDCLGHLLSMKSEVEKSTASQ